MHTHRHLRLRETLSERREIWYTDAVQRVLFNGAGFGGGGCGAGARASHVHAARLQSVCASDRCKLETLWVSVTNSHGRRFNVCALYRPPNHSTAQFSIDLECLESQVQRVLLSSTDPLLLTGDINCNLLSVDTDPCKTKLLEFFR